MFNCISPPVTFAIILHNIIYLSPDQRNIHIIIILKLIICTIVRHQRLSRRYLLFRYRFNPTPLPNQPGVVSSVSGLASDVDAIPESAAVFRSGIEPSQCATSANEGDLELRLMQSSSELSVSVALELGVDRALLPPTDANILALSVSDSPRRSARHVVVAGADQSSSVTVSQRSDCAPLVKRCVAGLLLPSSSSTDRSPQYDRLASSTVDFRSPTDGVCVGKSMTASCD